MAARFFDVDFAPVGFVAVDFVGVFADAGFDDVSLVGFALVGAELVPLTAGLAVDLDAGLVDTRFLPEMDVDLVVAFTGLLLAMREDVLAGEPAVVRPADPAGAIATMRAAVFFAGIAARTCLIAFVCCSSVIRNS